MSIKKKAISGVSWTFANQFGSQGVTFLVSIILARILEPRDFGIIGMITIFMAIGSSLIDSGLTQSLIRTQNPDQEDFSTAFFFNLLGSIVIYTIMFFSSPWVADFFDQPVLKDVTRVYCISYIINAFSTVQLTRLTKAMNFKVQLIATIPSIILSGLLGILLARMGYGVWSLVWMNLAQSFLKTVQIWWHAGWTPSWVFNPDKFKDHFKFSYKLTLASILNQFFNNIYQILIGKFFSPAQVGFYTRANSLKQLPVNNISLALNKVTYPLFAAIQHDDVKLKSAYKKIMQMVVFVIAPVLIILGVLAEPVFRFLFTEKWLPAVPFFQILCLGGILYPLHSYNLNVLNVKGRSDLFLKLEIAKKIVILAAIVITIPLGIEAMLWGQLITSVLSFFINTHYTGRFINYNAWEQTKDISPVILLAFVAGGAVAVFDSYLVRQHTLDIIRIASGSFLGIIVYLTGAWLTKADSLTELKMLRLKK